MRKMIRFYPAGMVWRSSLVLRWDVEIFHFGAIKMLDAFQVFISAADQ
jgi:hypothetical protein